MVEKVRELAVQVQECVPEARVDFTHFPSGSAMLDVCVSGRLYVLYYSPSYGFGVDEVREGEGFQLGYRYVYDEFEPAANRLREFIGRPQFVR